MTDIATSMAPESAMMGDVPHTALREVVFAHPTLTESLNDLFMTLVRARGVPRDQRNCGSISVPAMWFT